MNNQVLSEFKQCTHNSVGSKNETKAPILFVSGLMEPFWTHRELNHAVWMFVSIEQWRKSIEKTDELWFKIKKTTCHMTTRTKQQQKNVKSIDCHTFYGSIAKSNKWVSSARYTATQHNASTAYMTHAHIGMYGMWAFVWFESTSGFRIDKFNYNRQMDFVSVKFLRWNWTNW